VFHKKLTLAVAAAAFVAGGGVAQAETQLAMVGFGGASNLPVWLAMDRGLFKAEGIDLTLEATRGSIAQMKNMMSGKYQVASTSIDNVIAYTEGQGDVQIPGFDMVCVAGVHSGLNSVVTRPEIKNYAAIKGKPVAVDAVGTGYAFVLYRILAQHGLKRDRDYSIAAVGGGPERLKALEENKAVAAVISAPNDTEAKNMGYNILADAAAALGGYQGSAYCLRKSWAKTHHAETVAWIRTLIKAHDTVFADRNASIAVLKSHIKNLSDADAATIYTSLTHGKGGLNKRAAISTKGMKTVLSLRNEYAEPHKNLTKPAKYYDLSYWKEALKGVGTTKSAQGSKM
jgi:ABC-type nitrate/sulfonate/bicarbonate transport system substrate-binding protein